MASNFSKTSTMTKEVLNQLAENSQEDDSIEESSNENLSNSAVTLDDKEVIRIGDIESKRVFYTRFLMLLVLVSVATAVSVIVYLSSHDAEQAAFESSFEVVATKLASEFTGGANRRIVAIESFAHQITSHAIATNSSWPNVVLPDYERRAKYILELSQVLSVIFLPIVTNETLRSWEEFSVENQGWVKEGLAIQGIPPDEWDQESISIIESTWGHLPDLQIPDHLFDVSSGGLTPVQGEGPFVPVSIPLHLTLIQLSSETNPISKWWQFAPVAPFPTVVNYNTLSHPTRTAAVQALIEAPRVLVTEAWDYADVTNPKTVGKKAALNLFIQHGGYDLETYEFGPVSDLYVPIYDSQDDDKSIVAELTAYVYWQNYFEKILSKEDVGISVILENTCGQVYTYRVDGSVAKYIGQGMLHDREFDYLEVTTDYNSFLDFEGNLEDLAEGQCLYRLRIFPSAETQGKYLTNEPRRVTILLASTFLFTCAVFLLYDFLVESRQKLVMNSAKKSGAVVASLFPKEVRDRLYNVQLPKDISKVPQNGPFLTSNSPEILSQDHDERNVAIADLYPNCTVCFIDVVGFTHWSSTREPWQVFKLLETLYKTFDKSAKRLEVFKVETVGDCYVAVTGLPNPQDNHAILMAQFVSDCFMKVDRVTQHLVPQLGPDTSDLCLRIGLHSGAVTAGVLRGAKARFQLFGDTVNTAARMESTSVPKKIQVSSSTADQLTKLGKGEWVEPREDDVEVKGKGTLRTYWLKYAVVVGPKAESSRSWEARQTVSSGFTPDDSL